MSAKDELLENTGASPDGETTANVGLYGLPAEEEVKVEVPSQPAPVGAKTASEAAEDVDAAQKASSAPPKQGFYRILVVEDTLVLRKMLVRILNDAGHVCDVAGHGHEGLAYMRRSKATNHPYDLIMTDLMMPEMDGWEFIDNLIEKRFFPAVPVIILTAQATVESVKRSGRLGIRNFVVKPFTSERVLEAVKKAISRGRDKTPATPPASDA